MIYRVPFRIMLCVIVIVSLLSSCESINKKQYTSKDYLNHTKVVGSVYSQDSIGIISQLRQLMLQKEEFFQNSAYFDSTELIIDSILYNPGLNRIAVLVIIKNPTRRQLVPDYKYEWYYDETCYIGVKSKDTLNLSWIGPSFTNSYEKKELSDIARDYYFTSYASRDSTSLNGYRYNLNDIRFWDSSIWQEAEQKKERRKKFEEEKQKYPQNTYESK